MSAFPPPFAWQRLAPVVVAADRPRPSAEPLWKAYPLDRGKPTSAAHPPAQRATTTTMPLVRLDPPARRLAPLAVVIVFYAVLVGLVVRVAGPALRCVRLRRSREPVTCEMSWSQGGRGGGVRATMLAAGDEPRLVAESRPLEGRPPVLPDEGARSYDAYAELVRNLVSQGREPFDRGRDWCAVRPRRIPSAGPPSGALRG